MERLLDNDTRRRLKMIELLYAQPGWQTTKTLTKELKCSESVLLKDITMYNSLFQNYKELPEYQTYLAEAPLEIVTSHHGIHFIFPAGLGLDFFYQFVLKTTPAFQLLELVFFDETLTVAQLAEKLFFSVPTVYRLITKINQALAYFAIELKPNPCKMTGNEAQIRYFYSNYFLESYSLSEWPFPFDERAFNSLLQQLFQPILEELDVASFQQIRIRTAVHFTRHQQGYRNKQEVTIQQRLVAYCEPALATLNEQALAMSVETVVDVFGLLMIDQQLLDTNTLYPKIMTFIQQLAQSLKLDFPANSEKISKHLLTVCHLTYHFASGPSFILYNAKKAFMISVADNHPALFFTTQNALRAFLKEFLPKFTPGLMNDLLYCLFTCWNELIALAQQPIRLLILSSRNQGHAQLIDTQLSRRYGNRIQTEIYHGITFSQQGLEDCDFDILISDASFFFTPPKSSIWINSYPTCGDFERIETALRTYELKQPLPQP
ncbi:helix-turn-helix domain-containing protein [Vagococcus sp. BWB3-3]|uniref:Helix-turn-helix domain-containing protein n=1 Tax=Vagococcus allomyrinae TaxID=2794353 RepID=A0A940STP6_9ENTE|nr:helix-turn-helix domain-containing protein [Vagococcus allomyrinae]MBP1043362.1 helix-turn-helix domain-containing protein [Vagococcus allomyrinae]